MITPSNVVKTVVKDSLIKDFGVALSTLIILQNSKKCDLIVSNLDKNGYIKLVDAIASDYRVTRTLNNDNALLKKSEWLAAIE